MEAEISLENQTKKGNEIEQELATRQSHYTNLLALGKEYEIDFNHIDSENKELN